MLLKNLSLPLHVLFLLTNLASTIILILAILLAFFKNENQILYNFFTPYRWVILATCSYADFSYKVKYALLRIAVPHSGSHEADQ